MTSFEDQAVNLYLTLDCPECGTTMRNSLILLTQHDGIPELDIDLAVSQLSFTCDGCEAQTFLGDILDTAFTETDESEEDDE